MYYCFTTSLILKPDKTETLLKEGDSKGFAQKLYNKEFIYYLNTLKKSC